MKGRKGLRKTGRAGDVLIVIAAVLLAAAAAPTVGCHSQGWSGPVDQLPGPIDFPTPESPVVPGDEAEDDPPPQDGGAKEEKVAKVVIAAEDIGDVGSHKRVVKIAWSLENVSGSYLTIPPPPPGGLFTMTKFIGDKKKPHLGTKVVQGEESQDQASALLADPLDLFDSLDPAIIQKISGDIKALPFNVCHTNSSEPSYSCYAAGQQDAVSLIRIFFPLRPGETFRSGEWYLPISDDLDEFSIVYRDALAGTVQSMDVMIQ